MSFQGISPQSGEDNIEISFFKIPGQDYLLEFLLQTIQQACESGEGPDNWKHSIIIILHKKGSLLQCDNFRGISLLNHIGKIYEKILYNRLKEQ